MEEEIPKKKENLPEDEKVDTEANVTINVIKKNIKEKITFWDILEHIFWLLISLVATLVSIIKFDIIKTYPFKIGYIVLVLFTAITFSSAFNLIKSIADKLSGVMKYLFLITIAIVIILIIILHAELLVLAEELLSPLIEFLMLS